LIFYNNYGEKIAVDNLL